MERKRFNPRTRQFEGQDSDLLNKLLDDREFVLALGNRLAPLVRGGGLADAPKDSQEYTRQDGAWVVATGGGSGDEWGDVVDADIVPDGDGTRDLGATGTRFAETYTDALDVTNNITVGGTVDGRDVAADGTKLDGIESSATADQSDAEIKTAYENNADTNAFTDADHTKLDGIETAADVTDATNVTAAGALMDSELASIADVKALDQSVISGATPTFTGTNFTGVPVAGIADGTDGELITWGTDGTAETVAAGTSSQVLTSNGAGAAPTFQDAAGGGGGNPYGATYVIAASGGDFTTIDAWHADAGSANGDILYVEPGTYTEASALSWSKTNITVIGSNPETTVISHTSASNSTISGANWKWSGIKFESSGNGRLAFSGDEVQFEGCHFRNTNANILQYQFSGERQRVVNCFFQDTAANPRSLYWNGANSVVSGCTFEIGDTSGDGTYGCISLNAQNITFTGNNVFGDNTMNGASGYFLSANSSNITVTGCNFYNNDASINAGATAVYMTNQNTFTGNNVRGFSTSLKVDGLGQVSGNRFEKIDTETASIIVVQGDSTVITGNMIDGDTTGATGITINASINSCTITGNVIYQCLVGVLITDSACDNNVIVANAMPGNTTDITDNGTGTSTNNNTS